ncbi:MAG: hypothetical protein LBJ18_02920 [Rickettsiales bacterium]|jgi:hypothetical protein|nr:hypothetical protein [Rickettsiales bacterium]
MVKVKDKNNMIGNLPFLQDFAEEDKLIAMDEKKEKQEQKKKPAAQPAQNARRNPTKTTTRFISLPWAAWNTSARICIAISTRESI